jgi:hypothetical protein
MRRSVFAELYRGANPCCPSYELWDTVREVRDAGSSSRRADLLSSGAWLSPINALCLLHLIGPKWR